MPIETPSNQPAEWLSLPVIATIARLLCRELTLQNEYLRLENLDIPMIKISNVGIEPLSTKQLRCYFGQMFLLSALFSLLMLYLVSFKILSSSCFILTSMLTASLGSFSSIGSIK